MAMMTRCSPPAMPSQNGAGFTIVIVALVSYIPIFTLFPVTRDIPWANYLLFLLGGGLLAAIQPK
jgi:hypothetical protein